jgi:hypothetical protein
VAFQPSHGTRIIHTSRIPPQATAQEKTNDQTSEQNYETDRVHAKSQHLRQPRESAHYCAPNPTRQLEQFGRNSALPLG